MMENLIKRLRAKRWGELEISKTVKIIRRAKQDRQKNVKFHNQIVYGVLLLLVATANFGISIALIPYLIVLRGMLLYSVIFLLGVSFGYLFEIAIRSMEHLEREHHLHLAILLPLIALADLFIISKITNEVIINLKPENAHNPLIVSSFYAMSFVLPYVVYKFVLKRGYYLASD